MLDGKVISGSEYGDLLLWEGNLIKCRIVQDDGDSTTTCHDGKILCIHIHEDKIISAGYDGLVKQWSYKEIDDLEPDESQICAIKC